MTDYLLSTIGVVFLTVILGAIVPSGKLNKIINFILRIVCIAVMIQPLGSIFNIQNDNFDIYDEQAICATYSAWQSKYLQNEIKNKFSVDCECTVSISYEENTYKQNGVSLSIDKKDSKFNDEIYEYLRGLGYININVDEKYYISDQIK